jgi:homoserine dehydrogenase
MSPAHWQNFSSASRICSKKHDVTFSFTGLSTGRHGFAVNPDGLDIQKALELVESGQSISALSVKPLEDSMEVIHHSQADVMFENSPVNTETGQPALDHIRTALNLGMHAITANKGPVVHGYRELTGLSKSKGKSFRHESTVLGGAPVFSVMREAFPLGRVESFKGIFNATTNVILSLMENGEKYEEAVKYAQSIGLGRNRPHQRCGRLGCGHQGRRVGNGVMGYADDAAASQPHGHSRHHL